MRLGILVEWAKETEELTSKSIRQVHDTVTNIEKALSAKTNAQIPQPAASLPAIRTQLETASRKAVSMKQYARMRFTTLMDKVERLIRENLVEVIGKTIVVLERIRRAVAEA